MQVIVLMLVRNHFSVKTGKRKIDQPGKFITVFVF